MSCSKYKNLLELFKDQHALLWAFRNKYFVESYKNLGSSVSAAKIYSSFVNIIDTLKQKKELLNLKSLSDISTSSILNEIHCSYNILILRLLGYFFAVLFESVFTGVFINEETIFEIKSRMGQCPLILVPSHRSYCDFLLLAFIFFAYGIEVPSVAAGIDFASMNILSEIIRSCKAFFIRRSFNSDIEYKTILQHFVQHLVCTVNSAVEFFLEGTRSRSGKFLKPKFGLLKMICDVFTKGDVPDLLFVPVYLSYDKAVEEMLFSYELLGIPKPKESTSGFFKALKLLDEKYGNVYVNFGEPISLKSFLGKSGAKLGGDYYYLEDLGTKIIERQQELQVFSFIHLLSFVLHDEYVKYGKVDVTVADALLSIPVRVEMLKLLGASVRISDDLSLELSTCLKVHKSLITVADGCIILLNPNNSSKQISRSLRGAQLKQTTMNEAITLLRLQMYINPLLSYLADLSLLVNLVLFINLKRQNQDILFREYSVFRELYSCDIFLTQNFQKEEFDSALNFLLDMGVLNYDNSTVVVNKKNPLLFSLACLLYPFLLTYETVTSLFLEAPFTKRKLEENFKESQLLIQDKIISSPYYHHASLSLDTMSQAIEALVKMNILERISQNDGAHFFVKNVEHLEEINEKLKDLVLTFNDTRTMNNCLNSKL